MSKPKESSTPTVFSLLKPLAGFVVLIVIGVLAYMKIEGFEFLDALFMSVETLSTVGYGFLKPSLSVTGKIFTIIYILFGVALFFYLAAEVAHYVFVANFDEKFKIKKMEGKLKKLKNHYIICGYGRTGMEIAEQLKHEKLDFVVIDNSSEIDKILLKNDILHVVGDATDDKVLSEARIEHAKGIFCSLSDDVDNLYLTISARNINSNMDIIARCVKVANEEKFKQVGATSVILPYEISARRMVASVVKPMVVDFLDVVTHTKGHDLELKLDQFYLHKTSSLIGKTIITSKIKDKTGITVVALKRDNEFITNPDPNIQLEEGDYIIAIGSNQQLEDFKKLL